MTRNRLLPAGLGVVIVVVAFIAVISGGSARTTQRRAAGGSAISVRTTSLGKTLADANGRTLYLFQADKRNVSTLSKAGFAVWPAFTATRPPKAEGGVNAALIGSTADPGATKLVTYNGHPLYYYVGDRPSGSTRGQGLNQFGALWYVLTPSGNAITRAPSTTAPASAAPAPSYSY